MTQNPYQSPQCGRTPKGAWRRFWRPLCIATAIAAVASQLSLTAFERWLGDAEHSALAKLAIGLLALATLVFVTLVGVTGIGWILSARPDKPLGNA